jgi:diguanylate cyclase (GGDEF)-like protein
MIDRPVRILLVEDSEDDALLLRAALEPALPGIDMRRVDNAADMKAALESDWDVVISDHSMPRFDAFRALRVLKASGRDIPFVIFSGALEQEEGVSAMHVGAEDFVDKGNYGRLLPVLTRALNHVADRRARDAARDSAERLAHCDQLTGLPNRSGFEELCSRAIERDGRVMLVYLDADRFMRINDSFGYSTGDALLRLIADRLREAAGPGEYVGRIGHDEFAMVAPVVCDDAARARAERVIQVFAESFPINGQSLFLTASIGVALAPKDAPDAAGLLRNAEAAMFSAKRQGRNGIQFYARELNSDSGRRLRLENALRNAVSRNELFLVYQPIVDTATGAIRGAEALARWRHPELGMIPPDQFIAIADESGQIREIGDWVLRTAAAQTRAWHDRGWNPLSIAVNFSAAQFKHPGFGDDVRRMLEQAKLDASQFELEITETLAMQNAEATSQTLHRLKDIGVRVSIDDFGTGYSSLGYLRRFPIDILKIDRSFVRDADVDGDSAAIVRTIVALARSLKLVVLAEGVETREQYEFLKREGVDRMQGYYFAKPCEAAEFEALLAQRAAPPLRAVA